MDPSGRMAQSQEILGPESRDTKGKEAPGIMMGKEAPANANNCQCSHEDTTGIVALQGSPALQSPTLSLQFLS